ncbi:MAG: NUDIX hydrolase [Candidatus Micrarchaeota archaeon]
MAGKQADKKVSYIITKGRWVTPHIIGINGKKGAIVGRYNKKINSKIEKYFYKKKSELKKEGKIEPKQCPRIVRCIYSKNSAIFLDRGGNFLDYIAAYEVIKKLRQEGDKYFAEARMNLKKVMEIPHAVGVSVLTETNDKYVLFVQRSKKVLSYPNTIHYVAGYIESGIEPYKSALKEIKEEIGVCKKDVSFVGDGMRTLTDEETPAALTTFYDKRRIQLGFFYVARINLSKREVQKKMKNAKDLWESKKAFFVPRSSKSIGKFIKDKEKEGVQVAMPPLLELYLEELEKREKN